MEKAEITLILRNANKGTKYALVLLVLKMLLKFQTFKNFAMQVSAVDSKFVMFDIIILYSFHMIMIFSFHKIRYK